MGKIIISENVSLDGVVQDPTGEEGFRHGGWVGRVGEFGTKGREEAAKVLLDEALGTEAMLLGRRSYEFFAARWPSRTGALADRLNSKPKYVVSSTLQDPAWNNSAVLKGDAVSEVSRLKQQVAGDIVVAASFQLVHTLIALGHMIMKCATGVSMAKFSYGHEHQGPFGPSLHRLALVMCFLLRPEVVDCGHEGADGAALGACRHRDCHGLQRAESGWQRETADRAARFASDRGL
jgi:dihydrofolate reductase